MNIIFNDFTHIVEFIAENKGRYSESYIAGIVKHEMETEFASELAIDAVMLQAKPMTILGERLIAYFGNKQAALDGMQKLIDTHTLEEQEELFGFRLPRNQTGD